MIASPRSKRSLGVFAAGVCAAVLVIAFLRHGERTESHGVVDRSLATGTAPTPSTASSEARGARSKAHAKAPAPAASVESDAPFRSISQREERREFLASRARSVSTELAKVDEWFDAMPALPREEAEMAGRRARAQPWADRLGLRIQSSDCRSGVCRVELVPDPKAERHTILRPIPRIDAVGRRAALFRLPSADGLKTVIFQATGDAELPPIEDIS